MMQKIKRFFLAFLVCLTMCALTPFAAFAAMTQEDAAQVAKSANEHLLQIVTLDDQSIQDYIDQFNKQQKGKIANGLDNWRTLRQELGPFTSLDSTEVRETDAGYMASMQITCGERTVTVQMTYDESDGEMLDLSFVKNETMSEKLQSAAFNMIVGMGVVFLVLIFIAFIISRFKYINRWVNAKEERKKKEQEYAAEAARVRNMPATAKNVSKRISPDEVRAAVIPEGTEVRLVEADKPEKKQGEAEQIDPQTLAVIAAAVAAAEGPDAQLLAVITAAVMAYEGESAEDPGPDGLVVRSIRRVSRR